MVIKTTVRRAAKLQHGKETEYWCYSSEITMYEFETHLTESQIIAAGDHEARYTPECRPYQISTDDPVI